MKYLLSILKKNNNMSKINSTFWYKNIFYFTKYQILILAFTFFSICNVNSQKNNNAIIDDSLASEITFPIEITPPTSLLGIAP